MVLHVNRGDVVSNAQMLPQGPHALPPRERHERAGPAWVFEPIQTRGDGARTEHQQMYHTPLLYRFEHCSEWFWEKF